MKFHVVVYRSLAMPFRRKDMAVNLVFSLDVAPDYRIVVDAEDFDEARVLARRVVDVRRLLEASV